MTEHAPEKAFNMEIMTPLIAAVSAAILAGIACYWITASHQKNQPLATQVNLEATTPTAIDLRPTQKETGLLIRESQKVDFIVRFEAGLEPAETCLELAHEALPDAQKAFQDWAETEPALSDLALKSASYSGEMILTWDSGIRRPLLRNEVSERLERLRNMKGVRYADQDSTYQAQETP